MLNRKTTALVVIDIQGKLARMVDSSEALIRNVQTLVRGAEILDIPVLWIEQNPDGLGSTIPELAELMTSKAVTKTTFSCCGSKSVMAALSDLRCHQLLVCGIESHVCVYQSVAALLENDYQVELVVDAISSRTAINRELGINKMRSLGAGITGTEMCLFELVQDCKAVEFKALLPLIR